MSPPEAAGPITAGLLLGWSVAWPPGPVNAEMIRRGLTRGFRAAAAVGFGACSADFLWALAVTGGAAVVAGAVLVPLAYRGVSSAADAPDDRDYADRFARARRLEIAGALALSFGAALVTSAVVRWIVLARRKPAATGVARRTTMRAR